MRDGPEVVRADRHPHQRACVEQPAGELLEVPVAVPLALVDGRAPAVLAGLDHLVIPVRPLHQSDHECGRALCGGCEAKHAVQVGGRIAQVRLEHQPHGRALTELRLLEQLEHQLERGLEGVD